MRRASCVVRRASCVVRRAALSLCVSVCLSALVVRGHARGEKMGDKGGTYGDVARRFACSSFSVAVATGATNPIDVLKVRLQVPAGANVGGGSGGFIGTAAAMWRLEGPGAFLKGTRALQKDSGNSSLARGRIDCCICETMTLKVPTRLRYRTIAVAAVTISRRPRRTDRDEFRADSVRGIRRRANWMLRSAQEYIWC